MFSTAPRATRRVRIVSAALAAGAMIAAFSFTASSASAVDAAPVNTIAPVITGNLNSGGTVSANAGTWSDDLALPYEYSWRWTDAESGDVLSDDETYTVDQSEIGHQLKVTVTAGDTNGASGTVSVLSTDVPQPVFTNTVAPSISGSLTLGQTLTGNVGTWTNQGSLTFTYYWGVTSGNSGGPTDPEDTTTTHVTNSADFGQYNTFNVVATDGTSTYTVHAQTSGLITPAAPFATDAGLTSANVGGVSGSQTKTDATLVLPADVAPASFRTIPEPSSGVNEGDLVYVYGYSTPTGLGFFTVNAAHTITVPLGALPKGLHKLAVINSNGNLIGWLSVTAGGGLASTGVNVNAPLELGGAGALILLGILSVVFVNRQRRIAITK